MNIILKAALAVFILTGCTQTQYTIQKFDKSKNGSSQSYSTVVKKNTIATTINSQEKTQNSTLAIVFPSHTIGKYALEATNSINTYLINKEKPFKLQVYDIVVQNKENLVNIINKIKEDNISRVIAMITKEDLKFLKDISGVENIKFYLPLINKDNIDNIIELNNLDLTFGAISYHDQFEKLIEYSNGKPLSELYGNSGIGRTLHQYLEGKKINYSKKIDDNNGQYKFFLENNSRLENSVVLLNTPIVKSSILLSAINSQELMISKILSTQLNYTPLLFSLTQERDRNKLVIANS
ncbi:MAG: hypothetical protein WBG69_04045, partial [Arcobacteraceae bacterium]